MKYNRLVVIIENKSGGMYQVALSENEQNYVLDLVSQLHKGKVKIMNPKLPMNLPATKLANENEQA